MTELSRKTAAPIVLFLEFTRLNPITHRDLKWTETCTANYGAAEIWDEILSSR